MAGCGTTNVKFQLRRDIEENWAGKTLLPGEPAFSTDTNGLKIGPGLWNDLSYIGGSGPSGPSGPSGVSGPSGPSGAEGKTFSTLSNLGTNATINGPTSFTLNAVNDSVGIVETYDTTFEGLIVKLDLPIIENETSTLLRLVVRDKDIDLTYSDTTNSRLEFGYFDNFYSQGSKAIVYVDAETITLTIIDPNGTVTTSTPQTSSIGTISPIVSYTSAGNPDLAVGSIVYTITGFSVYPTGKTGRSGPSGPQAEPILINPLVANPGSAIYVTIASAPPIVANPAPQIPNTRFTASADLSTYGITRSGQQIIPVATTGGGVVFGLSNLFPLYVALISGATLDLSLTNNGKRIASLNPTGKNNTNISITPNLLSALETNQPIVFQTQRTDSTAGKGTIVPGNIYYSFTNYNVGTSTIKVKRTISDTTAF